MIAAIIATLLAAQTSTEVSYRAGPYEAIRKLRMEEQKLPDSARVKKALGVAYYAAGQHLLFRQKMDEAGSLDPKDAEPHYLLGRHYDSDVEDFAKAAAFFRAALERDPAHVGARAYLGHALEMSGDRENAIAAYEAAARRPQCEPVALAGLARLGKPDPQRMERCAGKDTGLLRALAKLATDAGRHRQAAGYLAAALDADPRNTALAYQLHRAWLAAGEQAKAQEALTLYQQLKAVYGGQ